jgi:hypothetical protein
LCGLPGRPWNSNAEEKPVAHSEYRREQLGREVEAPSGYYLPMREEWLEFRGRRLLYVLGSACIEASCCGVGSWAYLRVEGFATDDDVLVLNEQGRLDVETVAGDDESRAIIALLRERHPGVRIEFR